MPASCRSSGANRPSPNWASSAPCGTSTVPKSSKKWLRTLPVDGPQVICGPGGERGRCRYRRRSGGGLQDGEPQPSSYIEPHQGAATAWAASCVTSSPWARARSRRWTRCHSGARSPKTRIWSRAWSRGSAPMANAFGVPNVGGEVRFHPAMTATAWSTRLRRACGCRQDLLLGGLGRGACPSSIWAPRPGATAVGGATMASAEFDDTIEDKRPTVQVGDPFTERNACWRRALS